MKKLQQYYIFKIATTRLKNSNYKIDLSIKDARRYGEIVSMGDSQMFRSLRNIKGINIDEQNIQELFLERKRIKRKKSSEENLKRLIEIDQKIDDYLFIPEIISIFVEDKNHYKKIGKDGFILNNGQSIITPTYLSKHCKGIFNKLAVCFRDANGDIDWRNIAAKLSSEAKDKFKFNRTKESALKELNYLLKEKNPNKINSRYIKQLDSNLFDFISKNFKNVSGYIDWPLIVNHLSNDLRLRFAYPVRYDRSLPDEQYEDGAEVEKMLNENNKYFYTFFQASGTEDLEKRNEICLSLIELAKKGNKTAETKLIDLTYFLVDKWAETIPSFRVLKFHKETCYEIIRRCIYNYKIKGPFIGYVFASLKKAALGLEQMNEFSHNEHIDYKKSSFVE